jgi:hypothetical protein
MAGKYRFGYGPQIESPELDAFVADVVAVFEQHGVGISYTQERDYDYGNESSIVLVPFDVADFDWLTGDLEDYQSGVPWLDAAKRRYQEAVERADREQREKKRISDRARRDAAAAQKQAQIDAAVRDGIELGGKHYKLVEQPK